MNENPATYFKRYRTALGFQNQSEAKNYLAGKDLIPSVDYAYIESLINRLVSIIHNLDLTLKLLSSTDRDIFCQDHIFKPYQIIQKSQLIPKLNNQGRRPEEVLFSWLRGYVICSYFTAPLATLFGIQEKQIISIGDDNLSNLETFKRTPKADLEFNYHNQIIRLEIQSGFQGVNDIKEHKIREARRVASTQGILTIAVHIDLFNGQVAFVRLDQIDDNDVNFVTRQQMEGQSVFAIDQNYFKWRLLDPLPLLTDLDLELPCHN